jgi:hypothetical protein
MAKRVVIEVRNGEAVVLFASKGVEVVVKKPKHKKRGFLKRLRTVWYYVRKFLHLA